MKHYSIKILGKVQGVFFRDTACRKAGELNLTGFARNEPDGSVYIEAEGEEDALKEFVLWCQAGPPKASVEKVEVNEGKIKGFNEFLIIRY